MTTIRTILSHFIDDVGHTSIATVGLVDAVDGSLCRMPSADELSNFVPDNLAVVIGALHLTSLNCHKLFRRLATTNSMFALVPEVTQGARCS